MYQFDLLNTTMNDKKWQFLPRRHREVKNEIFVSTVSMCLDTLGGVGGAPGTTGDNEKIILLIIQFPCRRSICTSVNYMYTYRIQEVQWVRQILLVPVDNSTVWIQCPLANQGRQVMSEAQLEWSYRHSLCLDSEPKMVQLPVQLTYQPELM